LDGLLYILIVGESEESLNLCVGNNFDEGWLDI
jgi:hypothetical protein